jgi:aldehyde:ferredoxin oxidoreductase
LQTSLPQQSALLRYAAVALKNAGLDGFVLTGRAPRPSVLVIADGRI